MAGSAIGEVQVNEFLVAIVVIGTGFGFISWRRWTDLSRQVSEYKRLQAELSGLFNWRGFIVERRWMTCCNQRFFGGSMITQSFDT